MCSGLGDQVQAGTKPVLLQAERAGPGKARSSQALHPRWEPRPLAAICPHRAAPFAPGTFHGRWGGTLPCSRDYGPDSAEALARGAPRADPGRRPRWDRTRMPLCSALLRPLRIEAPPQPAWLSHRQWHRLGGCRQPDRPVFPRAGRGLRGPPSPSRPETWPSPTHACHQGLVPVSRLLCGRTAGSAAGLVLFVRCAFDSS